MLEKFLGKRQATTAPAKDAPSGDNSAAPKKAVAQVVRIKDRTPELRSLAKPEFLQQFNSIVRSLEERLTGDGGAIGTGSSVDQYIEVFASKNTRQSRVYFVVDKPAIDSLPGGRSTLVQLKQQARDWYAKQTKEHPINILILYLDSESLPIAVRRWRDVDRSTVVTSGKESGRWQHEIDKLLYEANAKEASDIHIERRDIGGRIRLRIHGELFDLRHIDEHDARTMIDVLWNTMAESTGAEWDPRQFGHKASARRVFRFNDQDLDMRVRLQILPHDGSTYDLVARLLPSNEQFDSLSIYDRGYHARQITLMERALRKKDGMICFAGTTGSGKTTSLAALAASFSRLHVREDGTFARKIITTEDPIEIQMPIATQILVGVDRMGKSSSVSFSEGIKWSLRGDPDMLVASEIRDSAAAAGAVQATISGHTLLTTVHAAAPQVIITRLHEMGVPLTTIGGEGFLNLLVYQMLAKTTCSHCGYYLAKDEVEIHDRLPEMKQGAFKLLVQQLTQTGIDMNTVRVRRETGCKHCNHMGITGRTPVAEVIEPQPDMLKYVIQNDLMGFKHAWYTEHGGWTLWDHALHGIENGVVDPLEMFFRMGDVKATNWKTGD